MNTLTPEQLRAAIADCLDIAEGNLDSARWYYGQARVNELSDSINSVIGAVAELRQAIKRRAALPAPAPRGAGTAGGEGQG